jgi:hypothetical protein
MTSFRNVNIRKNSPQKIPATSGTLNSLLQLRYQTISSFTAPQPWSLFQSRNMGHYMSAATFLLQRKQRACSVLDLVSASHNGSYAAFLEHCVKLAEHCGYQGLAKDCMHKWPVNITAHTDTSSCWYVNRGKVTSWRLLITPLAAPSIIKQVHQYEANVSALLPMMGSFHFNERYT